MKIAVLVLIVRDGKVLLGEKKRGCEIGTGTLNSPGGKFEAHESLSECAVRETWEECGLVLDPHELEEVAVITFYANGTPDFQVHVILTRHFSGKPHETKEMHEPKWYDMGNLPFTRMLESDCEWYSKALRGEKFRANVYYRERAKSFEKIEFFPYK